jgi:hypothetical protein
MRDANVVRGKLIRLHSIARAEKPMSVATVSFGLLQGLAIVAVEGLDRTF